MRRSYRITISDGAVHEVNGVTTLVPVGDTTTLLDGKGRQLLTLDPSKITSMQRLGEFSLTGKKKAVKLSPEEVARLLSFRDKLSSNELAEKFGISRSYVKKLFAKHPKNVPAKSCTLH